MTTARFAWLLLLTVLTPLSLRATGTTEPTTIVLVRHAEKAASDGDPELSDAGRARAAELARVTRELRFTTILTTPTKRTRSTAAPVAQRLALSMTNVETGSDHVQRLAQEVRKREGETILVVGHSNTIPELLRALGGPAVRMSDSDYDDLFVCTMNRGENARCVALHYGVPTP